MISWNSLAVHFAKVRAFSLTDLRLGLFPYLVKLTDGSFVLLKYVFDSLTILSQGLGIAEN